MSPSTKILPATDADLATIGEIIATANLPDAIMQFSFTDWPSLTSITAFFTARIRGALSAPETTVFKIIDESTGEILGVVCLGMESSAETEDRDLLKPTDDFVPQGMNFEFVAALIGKVHDLVVTLPRKHQRESGTGKSKYYALQMLAVHPKHQRKGLGTKLIQHCSAIADEDGTPIYLSSFPRAHKLYERLGYTDIDYFDVDLNEWGTKLSGYGVYRQYTMVRQPVKGLE